MSTDDTPSLFDLPPDPLPYPPADAPLTAAERAAARGDAARRARDEAIRRAAEHAAPDWKAAAVAVVADLAAARVPFTSDDVWRVLAEAGHQTHENRALGAVIVQAARRGAIVKTGRYLASTRPETHASPKAEWIGTAGAE